MADRQATHQASVSLLAFEAWVKTWEDYNALTEVDRYSQARQLGLFCGFLPAEMKSTLHHILGITQDSTDLPGEVINKLRAHILGRKSKTSSVT